jgi:predicted phosphodiesterase
VIAVFSDIHGNLPALHRFMDRTRGIAEAYICLGDVVNYGPWNDECLEMVWSLPGIVLLEGNHERLFRGAEPVDEEIPLVQEFYEHSIRHFTRLDLISNLPCSYELGGFTFTHTIDGSKVYADTRIEVGRNYFIGHTHHQFEIERNGNRIINCGSVGQNRKAINVINYALFDVQTRVVTLCSEEYPFAELLGALYAKGYSRPCIDYYLGKLPK